MIRFFAAHPTAANLLLIMLIAMGILAIPRLRRETFPDYTKPEVLISVVYPGATAEEVEEAICTRIEDAIDAVPYIKEVRADALENLAMVTVEMAAGADFQKFINDLKTEVDQIADFPDLAERPVVKTLGDTQPVVSLAVSGDMPVAGLKAYCEDLKNRLQVLDEVSLVQIQGFSDHQIRIEVAPDKLIQLGLSTTDLANIIAQQSLDLATGSIESSSQKLLIRLTEERRQPSEFAALVIAAAPDGAEIRLGDVATIRDQFELDEEKILFNGQRAGLLKIEKTRAEDALVINDAVVRFVAQEQLKAPKGIHLDITRDMTSITRDRLKMLVKNGWQGLVLVFFTLWLFFHLRLSFWVTMGLPVSFLGAMFFLPPLGMTINMITMVGLLLGLGLLMDDAIVIAENVATHVHKGKKVLDSVIAAVSEVKAGVFSSFLTTVAVFGPAGFLEGNLGKVLRVMPIVLILVLAVSLVEAFFILPNHLAHSMSHPSEYEPNRFRRWFDAKLTFLRDQVVGRCVDWAVSNRYLTISLTLGLFLASLAWVAGGTLKFKAFPDMDGDVIEVRLLMPQGTPLAATEAITRRIVEKLEDVNQQLMPQQTHGQSVVRNVMVQFNFNRDANESGSHLATVNVDLLPAEARVGKLDDLLNRWREEVGDIPDIVNLTFTEPSLGPAGRPVELRLAGPDLDQLKRATGEMVAWLDSIVGIRDLNQNLRPGKPEIRLTLRDGALSMGMQAGHLASQLRAAFLGTTVSEIQVGDEPFEVDVRLDPRGRDSLSDLETFHIRLPNGQQVPLSNLAAIETGQRGYSRIARIDGRRAVTIWSDVDSTRLNVRELMAKLQSEFLPAWSKRYPDLVFSVEGEMAETATTAASMRKGMMIGVLGIFVLLSFQFHSYFEPIIVMAAIPLSLIGVIWGHLIMGYPLTMPGMVGFVSLAGVVVNDAILLVTFIKNRAALGDSVEDAAKGASRDRFRAVLLTSLTTIAGLVPLLLERSLQAQVIIPLAISLIFGLTASTLLVLFVVPSLYTIVADFGKAKVPEQASA